MEPLLRLDSAYTTDHVTLYKNRKSKGNSEPKSVTRPHDTTLIFKGTIKHIHESQIIKPKHSKKFTPHIILKSLKSQFKLLWDNVKQNSPKLEFYNVNKSDFSCEHYISCINKFYDRANLAKLRISAHDLAIETGRYAQLIREKRYCLWCKVSMGLEIVEDECHALYNCDLYSSIRQDHSKTIRTLTSSNEPLDFMALINSPNTNRDVAQYQQDLDSTVNNASIIQSIANFVSRLFRRRDKFLREYKKANSQKAIDNNATACSQVVLGAHVNKIL